MVHIGPGAFFRAFNAVYTHEAMQAEGGDWGVAAVSLKSPTARDQLMPQGGVYTAVERGSEGETSRVITSVVDVLVAPEDPSAVIDLLADPKIKILSLTITEKGYGYDPATQGLDLEDPDIAADLNRPEEPCSAVGLIVAALSVRRRTGASPFTVLPCDNLPSNGKIARRVVLGFAERVDAPLADWIAEHVTFPSTMVDRITPATTEADVAQLSADAGYTDRACVVHEAFRQWVIEDVFVEGRPAWDLAGAQFVDDVERHELMKLRCLNGTHSALAYLGYLAGFETVSDAVTNPDFSALCEKLWREEIIPVVPQPKGEDLSAYCQQLMARYRDPSIRHRLWQIAMDGSQKLPQRILGSIADHAAEGRTPSGLCLVVAAWMRYASGTDEAGQPIDVRDPLADRMRGATTSELLAMREVFPKELAESPAFLHRVSSWYAILSISGARIAVAQYLEERV